jgi:hypothetical protein
MHLLATIVVGFTTFAASAKAQQVYQGSYSQISGDEACATYFSPDSYRVQHFFRESRISIMHFQTALDRSGTPTEGFFDRQTFMGNYGPDGDVLYSKEREVEGGVLTTRFEGILDHELIFLAVTVENSAVPCTASAEFFATAVGNPEP